jgi:hypothetical protein
MKFISSGLLTFSGFLFCLVVSTALSAQNNNNNIYTRFGLGSLESSINPQQLGMGGTGVASAGQQGISTLNPASLSFLSMTTFQAVGGGMSVRYNYQDQSANFNNGYLKSVFLGFKKPGGKWGFSLGMQPYSFVNYKATSTVTVSDSVQTSYTYEGNGGLNKATLGLARKFYLGKSTEENTQKQTLALGVHMNYIFGNINHSSKVSFPDQDNYNYGKFSQNHFMNGAIVELGALYILPLTHQLDVNKKVVQHSDLHVGVTYGLGAKLTSRSTYLDEILSASSIIDYPVDTTYIDETITFSYDIPQQLSFGLAWAFYKQKFGDLQLNAEYTMQDWSDSKLNLGSDIKGSNTLNASQRISLGLAYTPDNSVNTGTLRHCTYRVGYYNGQTYWKINDKVVTESAFTAGISIPVLKSLNKINLGASYYQLGEESQGLLQMTGFVYQVGVTIVPREAWFLRRKYD